MGKGLLCLHPRAGGITRNSYARFGQTQYEPEKRCYCKIIWWKIDLQKTNAGRLLRLAIETVLAAKKAILCESWCYSSFGEWSFGLRRPKEKRKQPRTANTRYKNRRERTKNQIAPVVNKIKRNVFFREKACRANAVKKAFALRDFR